MGLKPSAIVTGATSGIGRAIALGLHEAGYDVLAVGRRHDALQSLQGLGMRTLVLNLADRGAVYDALRNETPDVLINNAGVMPPLGPLSDLDDSDIDTTLAINLRAQITVTKALIPSMTARGKGHIFFTGSTAGHQAFNNMAVYCATKAAIGGFAQALRLELAPHNLRVTEIVAGRVETELYKNIIDETKRAAMYAHNNAVQPRDVAAMVLAVLALPQSVDVSRFDILPTHQK